MYIYIYIHIYILYVYIHEFIYRLIDTYIYKALYGYRRVVRFEGTYASTPYLRLLNNRNNVDFKFKVKIWGKGLG
jgi:hypothetical protein